MPSPARNRAEDETPAADAFARPAVRFRVEPQTRRRLDRLKNREKAINVSAWLRLLVQQGLDHEFPDDVAEEPEPVPGETPATPLPKPDPAKATIKG